MAESDTSRGEAGPAAIVSVVLPLPLDAAYDYAVPEGLAVAPGDLVEVPFGRVRRIGVVWGPGEGGVPAARVKPIAGRLDVPAMTEAHRRFLERAARYTMAPLGAVLRMSLSSSAALAPPRAIRGFRATATPDARGPAGRGLSPGRRRVLEHLAGGPMPGVELAQAAGISAAVLKGMVEAGLIAPVALPPPPAFLPPDPSAGAVTLSPAQAAAAARLTSTLGGGFSATLLDGVTGSGKTEVYFEVVAEAIRQGRQALVLLPEIALSAQWLERFTRRFGARPAVWHSEVPSARRRETWRAVAEGEARIVVGARSALFLPFAALGLIVVDEEHETAFKQEDGVTYQARDMAVLRAHSGDIPVVLASATPSLETLVNVESGRYGCIHLPERHGGAVLPTVEAIDLRRVPPPRGRFLSQPLLTAVAGALAAGRPAMLFLNRRGYAPLTLCRACGFRLECPNCSAWLVEHRLAGRLECHHCGHRTSPPRRCPSCEAEDSFTACGPGVERIAEEVDERLPDARWTIVASDTVTGPEAIADLARALSAGEVNLLIGTQILAKGHNFPGLSLVGVVDADLGLAGGDLRAAERTWQLLQQVGGRAGREAGGEPGRVLLQTWMPEHPVIEALVAGDRDGFLAQEAAARRERGLPPYGRLVALIISGTDRAAVDAAAQALGRTAPQGDGILTLGPAEAPLAVLRGRHRRRLLLKADRMVTVQPVVQAWLDRTSLPSSVRVQIDVDPYNFL